MKEVIYGENKCHITPRYVSRTHVPIFRKELIHISKDWGAIKHVSNLDKSVALGKSLYYYKPKSTFSIPLDPKR